MRAFVSIRPPDAVRHHLESALDDVRGGAGMALRWGDAEQWHLTLAFRAELPEGAVPDVLEDLALVAGRQEPLDLHLSGAGVFGGRTLWVGVGGDTGALERLMGQDLLGGEVRERHRAHLTVARVSSRAPRARGRRRGVPREADPTQVLLADAVRALSVYRGPTWRATELELVSSELGEGRSGGPLHRVVATVPLG